MAIPAANLTVASLEQLFAVFADDKTKVGMRKGVSLINEFVGILNRVYGPVVDVPLTADSTDADVAAFLAGDASASAALGVIRVTTATFDLTDNALATAKGSAVAIGDVYTFPNGTTVVYLGSQTDVTEGARAFDFVGETDADFLSIGS